MACVDVNNFPFWVCLPSIQLECVTRWSLTTSLLSWPLFWVITRHFIWWGWPFAPISILSFFLRNLIQVSAEPPGCPTRLCFPAYLTQLAATVTKFRQEHTDRSDMCNFWGVPLERSILPSIHLSPLSADWRGANGGNWTRHLWPWDGSRGVFRRTEQGGRLDPPHHVADMVWTAQREIFSS